MSTLALLPPGVCIWAYLILVRAWNIEYRRIIARPEKGDAEAPDSAVGESVWCNSGCLSGGQALRTPLRCDSGMPATEYENPEAFRERTKTTRRGTIFGSEETCASQGIGVPSGTTKSRDQLSPTIVACRSRKRTLL